MTQQVGRGGTITLDAIYRDGTGTAVDPVGPTVEILDPNGTQVVAPTAPARNPSVGRYEYDFTTAIDAPLGVWTARWTGTINSIVVSDDDAFTVADAGEVGFGSSRLATVAELEARTGITYAGAELTQAEAALDDASALVLQVGSSTWTDVNVPDAVRAVVLAAARRGLENPSGVRNESLDGYSIAYGNTSGIFLTKDERAVVARAGGRRVIGMQRIYRAGDYDAGELSL